MSLEYVYTNLEGIWQQGVSYVRGSSRVHVGYHVCFRE